MNNNIHSTAIVDQPCEIGDNTKIWHFSHICAGARIGDYCSLGQNTFVGGKVVLGSKVKVQNNVSIYDGVIVEDEVFLGPSCVLTNMPNPRSEIVRQSLYEKTLICRGATIGANATIVCGIKIGRFAFIGAGAVVRSDVPDYALMLGVPASRKGWMSRHGHILNFADNDIAICPESNFRYKLSDGKVHALDLTEDQQMPDSLSVGKVGYNDLK